MGLDPEVHAEELRNDSELMERFGLKLDWAVQEGQADAEVGDSGDEPGEELPDEDS